MIICSVVNNTENNTDNIEFIIRASDSLFDYIRAIKYQLYFNRSVRV